MTAIKVNLIVTGLVLIGGRSNIKFKSLINEYCSSTPNYFLILTSTHRVHSFIHLMIAGYVLRLKSLIPLISVYHCRTLCPVLRRLRCVARWQMLTSSFYYLTLALVRIRSALFGRAKRGLGFRSIVWHFVSVFIYLLDS